MTAIRKEWSAQCRNLMPQLAIVAGGFVLGRLLAMVIALVSGRRDWIPLGVVFAAFGLAAVFLTVAMQFVMGLNHAILMSRTRTGFMIGNYLMGMLILLLGYLVMLGLGWLEFIMAKEADAELLAIFKGAAKVMLHPLFLIGFPVVGVILADFIGALLARFGKRAGWTLWGLWMFGSLVLPRMMKASSGKDTLLTRLGGILMGLAAQITPLQITVATVVFAVAALMATIAMTRSKAAAA